MARLPMRASMRMYAAWKSSTLLSARSAARAVPGRGVLPAPGGGLVCLYTNKYLAIITLTTLPLTLPRTQQRPHTKNIYFYAYFA